MERRTYLAGVAATVAITAGCSGSDGDGGSSPEAAVETYIQALDNTDVDQYNDIIHPDGQLQEVTSEQISQLDPVDYTIELIDITEENEDTATARAEYSVEGPQGSETATSEIELRLSDGEWKIYSDVTV